MEIVMERNAQGLVQAGGISFSVPHDKSMLMFLDQAIEDGSEFRNDGWVYKNGQKVKRWTRLYNDIRIWEPALDNPERILRVYKMQAQRAQRVQSKIVEIFDHLTSGVAKDKEVIVHAKPNHEFESYGDRDWWEYCFSFSEVFGGWAYSFNWIPEPEKPINLEIGQRFYELERKSNVSWGKLNNIRHLLFDSLKTKVNKLDPHEYKNLVVGIQMDDCIFYYRSAQHGARFYWSLVSDEIQKQFVLNIKDIEKPEVL